MDKISLRKEIKARLSEMSSDEKASESIELQNSVIGSYWFNECDAVFLYSPLKGEPDTGLIFEECIRLGKTVAYPLCLNGNDMCFYKVSSTSQLVPGAFGISEPDRTKCTEAVPAAFKKPVIIVPGLAFDKKGNRLGRGKGFYDRYLAENEFYKKVGFCFKCQMVDNVPVDVTDVKVEML